jgi:diguanylate cyclase (GGDEF)-like protein
MTVPPSPQPSPPSPAWRRALLQGGAWTQAAALMGLAALALVLTLTFGALGLEGRAWALVTAGGLALALGAPLLWALRRLAGARDALPLPPPADEARDALTGAATRAHLLAQLEREWALGLRYGHTLALAIVEIDGFRRVCDRFGEDGGPLALRELALQAAQTLRGTDLLARFGEGQLAVVLPHADPLGALDVADRIRERGALLQVDVPGGAVRVTASVGVAVMRPHSLSLQTLLDSAEAALQAARLAGGNCVRAAPVQAERATTRGPSVGDNQAARGDG